MKLLRVITRLTVIVWFAAVLSERAVGQNELEGFDFDALEAPAEAAEADGPAAAPAAGQAGQTAAPTPPTNVVESAVIDAIRQAEPETPGELFRTVDQLIRLERPDVAAEYLNRLLALQLDDAALAELYREFGTAAMIRLARTAELAPQAGELAGSIMQAGRRVLADPERLRTWVRALNGENDAERFRAAEQLLRAGASSVPALVESIVAADDLDGSTNRTRVEVLVRLGPAAVEPLHAYLVTGESAARAVAIAALGRLGARESLAYLVAPLVAGRDERERQIAAEAWQRIVGRGPHAEEAVELLSLEADRAYQGRSGLTADPDDRVTRWTWDAERRQPVATEMRTADAAAVTAARLYADRVRIKPDDAEAVERYLVSRLTVDQTLGGLDQPLRQGETTAFDAARRAGSQWVNRVLRRALADGRDAAAMGAAEVLGSLGDASVLERTLVGKEAAAVPLVDALSHPNRRVRFRAAEAIVALRPDNSFHGAGRLMNVLDYFSTSTGARAAVVAHPNPTVAQTLAGMLSARGFRTAHVATARELEAAAASLADVELIMVSDSLNDASVWSTLENLRVHPHTARLPIAILARPDRRDTALRIAERHERTMVLNQTADESAIDLYLPQLLALRDRDVIDPQRRAEQAQRAAQLRAQITDGRGNR